MRLTTFAIFFYALLVGSAIAAPVELSNRVVHKPAIGSVVHVKPIDLKPNPAPQGEGKKLKHPAIVVGHGADDSDEIHVAPISHTEVPPAKKLGDLAPSSGLDPEGFVHVAQASKVSASKVTVDADGRKASDDEVASIVAEQAANVKAKADAKAAAKAAKAAAKASSSGTTADSTSGSTVESDVKSLVDDIF